MIYNHITVKVPGSDGHFLINPYGLHYTEVTASNLVKVDIAGNIVEESEYPVNPAGMLIHSTIHSVRDDSALHWAYSLNGRYDGGMPARRLAD